MGLPEWSTQQMPVCHDVASIDRRETLTGDSMQLHFHGFTQGNQLDSAGRRRIQVAATSTNESSLQNQAVPAATGRGECPAAAAAAA